MKKFSFFTVLTVAICLVAALFTGCSNNSKPEDETPVRVLTLKGPTGLGMLQLMDENANGKTANKYEFTICGSPDEIKTEIIAGRYDIAAVPINLASLQQDRGRA